MDIGRIVCWSSTRPFRRARQILRPEAALAPTTLRRRCARCASRRTRRCPEYGQKREYVRVEVLHRRTLPRQGSRARETHSITCLESWTVTVDVELMRGGNHIDLGWSAWDGNAARAPSSHSASAGQASFATSTKYDSRSSRSSSAMRGQLAKSAWGSSPRGQRGRSSSPQLRSG